MPHSLHSWRASPGTCSVGQTPTLHDAMPPSSKHTSSATDPLGIYRADWEVICGYIEHLHTQSSHQSTRSKGSYGSREGERVTHAFP